MTLERLPNVEKAMPVTITVFPGHLEGMYALIYFLDGLEKFGNKGMIPGAFELTMHYRELTSRIQEAQRPDEPPF